MTSCTVTPPLSAAPPRLSVLMLTYNHAPFVAQAVSSVLAQETDFDFELVIGDDCSTDGTREWLDELERAHGDRVRLVRRAERVGPYANWHTTFAHCRGEYIANLDGDDYWTDRKKLARQAALLDARPEALLCFHPVTVWNESWFEPATIIPPEEYCRDLTVEDLIVTNPIPASSVVLRRTAISTLEGEATRLGFGDWIHWTLIALQGRIGFYPENMGVYRIHSSSMWSSQTLTRRLESVLQGYDWFLGNLPVEHHAALKQARGTIEQTLTEVRRKDAVPTNRLRGLIRRPLQLSFQLYSAWRSRSRLSRSRRGDAQRAMPLRISPPASAKAGPI